MKCSRGPRNQATRQGAAKGDSGHGAHLSLQEIGSPRYLWGLCLARRMPQELTLSNVPSTGSSGFTSPSPVWCAQEQYSHRSLNRHGHLECGAAIPSHTHANHAAWQWEEPVPCAAAPGRLRQNPEQEKAGGRVVSAVQSYSYSVAKQQNPATPSHPPAAIRHPWPFAIFICKF